MANKIIQKNIAKFLMRLFPNFPDMNNFSLGEIFNAREYIDADRPEKDRIKLSSARYRYDYENSRNFFEKYFPLIEKKEFIGKKILDVGCFTGGRIVNWKERFGFGEAKGIDIKNDYVEAGILFAKEKGVDVDFCLGFAENIPFRDNYFDYVISYDVFEHVHDVEASIKECFRVLKTGGCLLAVFPPFFQPLEAHLGLVTKLPGMQLLFSSDVLQAAYCETIKERGLKAYWYSLGVGMKPNPGMKLVSLNGVTVNKFRQIIEKNKNWILEYFGRKPIFTDGKRSDAIIFRMISRLFSPFARLPVTEEFCLGRIACILKKH